MLKQVAPGAGKASDVLTDDSRLSPYFPDALPSFDAGNENPAYHASPPENRAKDDGTVSAPLWAQPIGPGSTVLVKQASGWMIGRCLAATPQVCLIEIVELSVARMAVPVRRRKGEPEPIDQDLLSDSTDWPPTVPTKFPLTVVQRGYVARVRGKTQWIAGKVSPRKALAIYHAARCDQPPQAARKHGVGSHLAVSWDRVFVPAQAPAAVVAEAVTRPLSQYAFMPTMDVPASIRHVPDLCNFPMAEPVWACVYFLCFCGHLVYVGKSWHLRNRIASHRKSIRFDAVFFRPCSRYQAGRMERRYIRDLLPTLNEQHKPKGPPPFADELVAGGVQ